MPRPPRMEPALFTPAVLVLAVVIALHGVAGPAAAQTELPPETAATVDAVFDDLGPDEPGCAVGVVADRSLVYGKGFGLANLDYGLPITTRSNFYLGSVGKQFTAAAVAHAARAGHLSLDDPLSTWFPELPDYEPTITVRHLVHHTSGIRDYLELGSLAGRGIDTPADPDDIVAMLARQKGTNFPAGERYLYSNSGYFLLAELVERATGRSLREYAEAELLGPLGMTRTRVHDDRLEPLPDRVVGYDVDGDRVRVAHPWNFDQVGSGGVYSSIEDLVHWDRNFYTEEAGGPGFTAALLERGILTGGDTIPYAFGLVHDEYRGLPIVEHGGALAGFRSQLLRFPDQATTVLVLCNRPDANPGDRARRVADAVLGERLEPRAVAGGAAGDAAEESPELTDAQLDAFTGHWRASMGIEIEIRRDDDVLVFHQGPAQVPLRIVSADVLRLEGGDITMTFSELRDGRYHHQDVVQQDQRFTAERFDPASPPQPAPSATAGIVGSFHSEELDATFRIEADEGQLVLHAPPDRDVRLVLVDEGTLRAPFGTLVLEGDNGRVTGFVLNAGRAQGIRFERVR